MAKKKADVAPKMGEQDTIIIGAIREYILTCPFLKAFEDAFPIIDVERADDKATTYMIESDPVDPVIKKYLDGSGIYRFGFVFASREFADGETKDRIENSGFYQYFADWIRDRSRLKELPELGDNMEAMEIKANTQGYVFDENADVQQYQIQCELKYYKKVGGI